MSVVVPNGSWGVSLDAFAHIWAASETFRSVTNTTTEAEAMAKTFAYYQQSQFVEPRFPKPYVLVYVPAFTFDWDDKGRGQFMGRFYRNVPAKYADSPQDALYDFMNIVDAIVLDIVTISQEDAASRPYLRRNAISVADGPARSDHQKEDDYFRITLQFSLGLER